MEKYFAQLGESGNASRWLVLAIRIQNIAKRSKAHIPPGVAIRGHTTLIGKKEKWTNMGLISNILYTVQLVLSDVCTKFQNSRSSSSLEIFDENFHIHYIGVRDRK